MPPETFSRSRALAPAPDGGPARGGCAVRNPKLKPKALRKRKAEAQSGWPSARSPGQRQRARRPADASPRHLGRRGRWALPPLRHPAGPVLPRPEGGGRRLPPPATAGTKAPRPPSPSSSSPCSAPPSSPPSPRLHPSPSPRPLMRPTAFWRWGRRRDRPRSCAGNVRVLRLHGTRAEGGEEDLAAMESPDYCRAVRDAFALGRRMEARMAARREVQTQVQQQAQEEGAIDRLERWYIFHIAAWART